MPEQFQHWIAHYGNLQKHSEKQDSRIGYGKCLLALLLLYSLYALYAKGGSVFRLSASIALLVALTGLWIHHISVRNRTDYYKNRVVIASHYLDRFSGRWTAFSDCGEEFADRDHPYACDLDMVGQKSLFQYLNVAHTWHGRKSFAQMLLSPASDKKELISRQEAIGELSGDLDFSCEFQYHASKINGDGAVRELIETMSDKQPVSSSPIIPLLITWIPVLTVASLISSLACLRKELFFAALILLLTQTVFWLTGLPRLYGYLGAAAGVPRKLTGYDKVFGLIEQKQYQAGKLRQLQALLTGSKESASSAIRELDAVVSRVHVRTSPVVYFLLNVLLLWDYRCAILLNGWQDKYGKDCEGWFQALGEFEGLLSFANLPHVCGNVCFPKIGRQGRRISARDIGHPLLPNDSRVLNDFAVEEEILIISGSNMSGKTTFLRTIGINLVLAQAGSMVCAGEMTCTPFTIVTSMRIADDLSEGISTFYAELKRVKTIVDQSRASDRSFFLIDEIFRGTNSVDRQYGASAVLEALHSRRAVGMITTHDLELCKLEQRYPQIKNYSFSEHYQDKALLFDYKLKSGPSRTTNAKYLMEMVGILEAPAGDGPGKPK